MSGFIINPFVFGAGAGGGGDPVAYSFTKIATPLVTRPASMGTNDGPFWPSVVDMREDAGFPYDWAMYFSTDHAASGDGGVGAAGGIWLYLANGDLKTASWVDYDTALANGDFDSFGTKPAGNPIFQYTATGEQTESPDVHKIGSTYYLFWHNNGYGNGQSTGYSTSSDGLNFTAIAKAIDYSPPPLDGHTGYFRMGPNPGFTGVTDSYVGWSYHGSKTGVTFHYALWSSDDATTWTRRAIMGQRRGRLTTAFGGEHMQYHIDAKSMRVLPDGRIAVLTSGSSGIFEIMLQADGSDFDEDDGAVRVIELGGSGDPDESLIRFPTSVDYDGDRFVFYTAQDASGVNTVMMSWAPIPTLAPEFPALSPAIITSGITEEVLDADVTGIPAGWSYNDSGSGAAYLGVGSVYYDIELSNLAFAVITRDATINPSNYDYIELLVHNMRVSPQATGDPYIQPRIGLFQVNYGGGADPTIQINSGNANPRLVSYAADGGVIVNETEGAYWGVNDVAEQDSNHRFGIRIWPQALKMVMMVEGVEIGQVRDLTGFNMNQELYVGAGWRRDSGTGDTVVGKFAGLTLRYG